ncbi:MAG: AI-2E family transporter [Candidatus Parcubacteria bacterium]|nr:AI-2E family transporter [Candidatus Parcubacteria bacterium]
MDSANIRKINLDISTSSIIKVLVVIFIVWILYLIRDVVAILLFAFIFVSILEPAVNWLKAKKIPRTLSVILIYLVLLSVFAFIIALIIPPISDQIDQISNSFPEYWQKFNLEFRDIGQFLNQYGLGQEIENTIVNLKYNIPQATSGVFSQVGHFFSGIFSVLIILVIIFYSLAEENATKRIFRSIMPTQYLPYAFQVFNRIQTKLGQWLRGQLILSFIVFLLVYIGLLFLGVKYALILGIIAGLVEFIPYVGPTLSGVLAVSLTFFQSPISALLVLILYIAIQLVQNNILTPKIMQRAVGLNPVVSIVALLIGGNLGGIIGAILAIPLATALSVFAQDFLEKKRERELKLEE